MREVQWCSILVLIEPGPVVAAGGMWATQAATSNYDAAKRRAVPRSMSNTRARCIPASQVLVVVCASAALLRRPRRGRRPLLGLGLALPLAVLGGVQIVELEAFVYARRVEQPCARRETQTAGAASASGHLTRSDKITTMVWCKGKAGAGEGGWRTEVPEREEVEEEALAQPAPDQLLQSPRHKLHAPGPHSRSRQQSDASKRFQGSGSGSIVTRQNC